MYTQTDVYNSGQLFFHGGGINALLVTTHYLYASGTQKLQRKGLFQAPCVLICSDSASETTEQVGAAQ